MYCLECAYNLNGLHADQCPECGLIFDPKDPDSFDVRAGQRSKDVVSKWIERLLIASGAVPLVANVFGMLSFLIARVSLGRWPNRSGYDDPSNVAGIGVFSLIAIVLVLLTFPALVMMFVFASSLLFRESLVRAARGSVIAIVLWMIGYTFVKWDPAVVWVWLFD